MPATIPEPPANRPQLATPKPVVTILPPAPKGPPEPTPFKDFVFGKKDESKETEKTPPAPDEKPPEAKTPSEVDDTPPEVKSEAGRNSWQTLKSKYKAAEQERDEWKTKHETEAANWKAEREKLDRELSEAKARFNPEEFDRLKSEHGEFWQKLRIKDIQELPEWRRRFVEPVERGVKTGLNQFPEEQRRNVEWLLRQPDSEHRDAALQELAAELSPLRAANLAAALQLIDSTRQEEEAVRKDEKALIEQHDKFQREESERTSAAAKLEAAKVFDSALAMVRGKKVPVFTEIEGNKEHNEQVAKAIEEAKEYYSATDNDSRAKLALWATIGPRAITSLNALKNENDQLKATLAKLQATTPKPPSGDGGTAPAKDDKSPFSRAVFGR